MKDSEFSKLVEEHKTPPPPPKPTQAKSPKSNKPLATRQQIVDKLLAKGFIRTPHGSFSKSRTV